MAQAGAVWMDVLPSMRDFGRRLRQESAAAARGAGTQAGQTLGRQMGEQAGEQFGRQFTATGTAELNRSRGVLSRLFRRAGDSAGQAGRQAGQDFGQGFTRDATGRLRNARGQFAAAGQGAGEGFGGGVETGGRGRLGGAVGALSGALAKAGPWLAAGAAIGGVVMKGVQGAMEREDATAALKARLGAFGPEGARLGKVAGDLYTQAYGESIGETTKAVEAVVSSIDGMRGANAAAVKDMSAKALALGKAFEVDVGRSMQVVGQMVRTGLVKDAAQGVDMLTVTLQKVPAAVRDDIVDALDEYGPFMTQIGVTGEKAFGLLAAGAQKGMYGIDKTGDALKEFTIRATDMSTGTQDAYSALGLSTDKMTKDLLAGGTRGSAAFELIITKLRGMKDPAQQSAAALALFGTPLEDLGTGEIPKFLAGLDTSQTSLGKTAGAAKQMGDTLHDTASNRLAAFTRGLKAGLVDFVGGPVLGGLEKLGDKLRSVPGLAQRAGDKLRSAFSGGGEGGLSKVADSFGKVGDKLRDLGGAGLEQFDKIKDKVGGLFATVGDSISEFRAKHGDKIDKTFRDISSAAAEFGDTLGAGLDLGKAALQRIGTVIGQTIDIVRGLWEIFGGSILSSVSTWFGGVIGTLRGAFKTIQGIFQIFTGILTGDWGKAWEGIKNVASGAFQFLTSMPRAALSLLANLVWSALSKIGGWFSSIFGGVKNWLTGSFLPWLISAPAAALSKLGGALWGGLTKIGGWFRSIFTSIRDWVLARMTSLRDGAVNRVQALRTAVTSRIQALRDGAVSRFTSLRDRAISLVTGLRDSVASRAQALRDRVVSAVTSLRDRAIDAFQRAASGIRSAWSKIQDYAKTPIRFVIDTVYNKGIRGVWNKIADKVPVIPSLGEMPLPRGFRDGGVVDMRGGGVQPGYSAKDNRLAMFRDGEGVLVPEAVRSLGSNFVHMANAMKGRASALLTGGKLPGFSIGGIVGDFFGKAKGHFAGGFVKAIGAAFGPMVNEVVSRFGAGNNFAGIPGKLLKTVFDKTIGWLKQFAGLLEGGDGKKVVETARKYIGTSGNPNKWTRRMGMNGLPWCAMFVDGVFDEANSSKALSAVKGGRAAVWSYRALRSVGQGDKKPGDLALYRGDTGHINIYTGKGSQTIGGNESNSVRLQNGYINSASSIRRPGFRDGGIVDLAAQDARETGPAQTHPRTLLHRGVLLPGTPDSAPPVLTDRQWQAATAQARGGDGGTTVTYNVNPKYANLDARQLQAITRAEEIKARAGRP